MQRLRTLAGIIGRHLVLAVITLVIAGLLAAAMTYAATIWRDTDWIADGEPIPAQKMRDNFEYLYWRLEQPFPCSPNASSTVRMADSGGLEVCNGYEWVSAGGVSGVGACNGVASSTLRIGRENNLEYCNGSSWVDAGIRFQ